MEPIAFVIMADDTALLNALKRSGRAIGQFTVRVENDGKTIDDVFNRIAKSLGLVFGAAQLKNFAQSIVNVRGEFQQLEIAFTTMLGSKAKADAMMQEVINFAATTPFDLKGVASGTKQLIAYGSASENIIDELRMLGDVAAGVSVPLNDIIYLYGTLRTQGRAYAVDIRQFAGRGIPIYKELAKVLEVNVSEVNALVEAGKVGFPQIEQAFKNMTAEGSMFGGMMDAQSKSILGQIERLTDAFDVMLNEIGKSNEGIIGSGISIASKLVENYEAVGKILAGLIATYGAYKAAVIAVSTAEKIRYQATLAHMAGLTKMQALTTVLTEKTKLLNKTMLANPYVLTATAVVGLVSAFMAFRNETDEVVKAQAKFVSELQAEKKELNSLFDTLKKTNVGASDRKRAVEAINEKYKDYLPNLLDEKSSLEEITKAQKKATAALAQNISLKSQEDALSGYRDKVNEVAKKLQNEIEKATKKGLTGSQQGAFAAEIEKIKESFQKAFDGNYIDFSRLQAEVAKAFKEVSGQDLKGSAYHNVANSIATLIRREYDLEVQTIRVNDANKALLEGLGIVGNETETVEEKLSTVADRIKEIKESIEKYENTLKGLRSDNAVVDQKKIKETQESIKALKDELELLAGSDKSSKKNNEDRLKAQEDFARKFIDAETQLEAARIAIMKEGKEKRLREIDVEYRQTMDKIAKERDEMIKLYNQANGTKLNKDTYQTAIPDLYSNITQQEIAAAQDAANKRTHIELEAVQKIDEIWDSARARFLSELDNELNEINKHYDQRVEAAKEAGDEELRDFLENQRKKERAAAESYDKLRKLQMNQEIDSLDLENKYSLLGMQEAYEVKKTEMLKRYAEQRIEALKALGDEQSMQEVKVLEKQIEGYSKVLKNAPLKAKVDDSQFEIISRAFQKAGYSAEEADKKATSFLENVANYANDAVYVIDLLQQALGGISEEADQALGAAMNIAKGFAQGGLIGGIAAAAGEATKGILSLANMEKDYQESKRRFMLDQMKAQREYNALLIEQMRIQKDGMEGILYSDYLAEIERAMKSLNEANTKLEEVYKASEDHHASLRIGDDFDEGIKQAMLFSKSLKGIDASLMQINVVTGVKKTGRVFKWKKTDEYSTLYDAMNDQFKDKYKGLIKENDMLDTSIAELILQNEKLDDVGRETLQNLVTYTKEYEAAIEQVNEVISGVFGDLGSQLGNSLVEAFKQGEDGMKSFEDKFKGSVGSMVETLITNMMVAELFKPILDNWGKELSSLLTGNKSSQDKALGMIDIASGLTSDVMGMANDAFKFFEVLSTTAKGLGMNIFQKDSEALKDKTLSGSIKTITEDTASVLAGQMNAIRIMQADNLALQQKQAESQINLIDLAKQSVSLMRENVSYNRETAQNTSMLYEINDRLVEISNSLSKPYVDKSRAKGY